MSNSRMREEAEAQLRGAPPPANFLTPEALLHELQVHQIELEMQNESLQQSQLILEESRDRYVDLYEFAPVGYLSLNEAGQIMEINLTGATLLREDRSKLLQRRFLGFVVPTEMDRWQLFMRQARQQAGKHHCELTLKRQGGSFDASIDCQLTATRMLRMVLSDISELKQSLAQTRASEYRYGSLFENMPEGLAHCRMIFDKGLPVDFEYIAVNPAFEKVTGLRGVVGRKISQLIPGYAKDNQISLDTFGRVAQRGGTLRWEHYLGALGKWFSFIAYGSAEGEFMALIENITERKEAELALRQLSLAVAQSPVSVIITDLQARIQYSNPAFSMASGYSALEARGQNPRLLQSGRTPPETYADLWATLSAGEVWRGEFINRRKDGTEYFESATISPVYQADGKISHYLAVKEDITELKRSMAELRSSEARLQLAKAASNLGIFDADLLADHAYWDERVRELWGVGADAPSNLAGFIAGVHPDDREATLAAIDQACDPRGNGAYSYEYRVVNQRDGSMRHVAANGKSIFENGRPVRFIGTLKDISTQKQLEKEIRARRSEMELLSKQQVAAQTVAAIAHELNQPLISISAYSEAALRMLRGGQENPGKLERALEGAVQQSQRAGQTLRELFGFLHKGEAVAEPVDLAEVIHMALRIAVESGYGEFRPLLDLEPGLRPVLANRPQLQKVVVNLLHNGMEAMRSAGVPTATINIKVRTLAEDNMALVTVQDCGPGLDADAARRVFEPFFTTKPHGIGLGLATSRALIEAHGGNLWVDKEASPGATFHFRLPFA